MGTLKWPDGRSYSGQWCDGKQHGRAIACTARGLKRESCWKDGRFVQWFGGVIEEGQPMNSGGEQDAEALDAGGTPVVEADGEGDANVLERPGCAEQDVLISKNLPASAIAEQQPADTMPTHCVVEGADTRTY